MSLRGLLEVYQTVWMFRSYAQQKLSWDDAAQARIARERAEAQAAAQLEAMLAAHPSGSLGHAKVNDRDALIKAGLL